MQNNSQKILAEINTQNSTLNAKQCMSRINSAINSYLTVSENCYDYMEDSSSNDGTQLYEALQQRVESLIKTADWLRDFDIIYQVDDFCQSAQDIETAFKKYVDGVGSNLDHAELVEYVKDFRHSDYELNTYIKRIQNQVKRINIKIADGEYSTYSYVEGVENSGIFAEQKEPAIGMTTMEIEQSTWGKPEDINKTTYSWGTKEQWCYKNNKYIYFENGIVTAISE